MIMIIIMINVREVKYSKNKSRKIILNEFIQSLTGQTVGWSD